MPPRKRARSSPGSSSSSDAAPLVLLDGGEPAFAPKLVDKWKSGKGFTDTTVLVDGQSFAAHKVVLASGSTYFEGLFQSETSDANAPALADTSASAFSPRSRSSSRRAIQPRAPAWTARDAHCRDASSCRRRSAQRRLVRTSRQAS